MAMKVSKMDVWVAGLKDVPGGLAEKLSSLADAGASLTFVLARRESAKPGRGVVFVSPIRGTRRMAAAKRAGFRRSRGIHGLRVEGADRPGLGAVLTDALAEAGINLRGLSAGVIGKRFVAHLALDKAKDAAEAARILRRL